MPPEDWDEIHGFASPGELERFQRWIARAVEEEAVVEIPVEEPYSGSLIVRRALVPGGERIGLAPRGS